MKIQKKGMFFSLMLPLLLLVSSAVKLSTSDKAVSNTEPTIETAAAEETTKEDALNYYTLDKLPLNRDGRNIKWKPGLKKMYGSAHTGFLFNSGDNNTKDWRPQGITGTSIGKKKFIIVSWYGIGKKGKQYHDRGGRISIVNVTNMDKIKYRHVLLVDKNNNTFPGCHVGGLALIGNKLHVADSRGSKNSPLADGNFDQILVFDITKIEKIGTPIKKYEYILKLESSYNSPINPSYISYDKKDNKLLIGTFTCTKCDFTKAPAEFVSFNPGALLRPLDKTKNDYFSLEGQEQKHNKQLRKIQGAATVSHNGQKYLVTASSLSNAKSRVNIYKRINDEWDWIKGKSYEARGLEDVYFSKKNFWTLSEFRPFEVGTANTGLQNRAVVATKISTLLK
jgi:hypothetical protein